MHELRLVEHHGFDEREILAAAAFDHVSRERPGTARETNQWNPAMQFAPDQAHRIHHVFEFRLGVRHRQRRNIGGGAYGFFELRALAFGEIKPEPHGVGDGENVGKKNRGIEREAAQRLQRHLAGEFRRGAERLEIAGLLAHRAILGQIPPRLAHDPHRRHVHGLPQ